MYVAPIIIIIAQVIVVVMTRTAGRNEPSLRGQYSEQTNSVREEQGGRMITSTS